jgi:glycosyltransferase involved in cell wall biosynthesis
MCTYNGEKYLAEQIETLLGQSYNPIEIIIVDDNSTDTTPQILENYKSHEKIRIYRNDRNLGYIKNFENAIRLSTGEFIALCDQDDVWKAEKIERMVQAIGKDVLIYHNSEYMNEQGCSMNRHLFDHKKYLNGSHPLAFVYGSCVTGHTLMFKKELLDKVIPFPSCFPHDWWISYVASSEGNIRYLDLELTRYRHHANNVLAGKSEEVKYGKIEPEKKSSELERLNILLNYKNISPVNRQTLQAIVRGYEDRKSAIFSFKLFQVLFRHRHELLCLKKGKTIKKLFFLFKEALGERWR